VIERTGIFQTQGTGHAVNLGRVRCKVKN
jgi:hypothetical protein